MRRIPTTQGLELGPREGPWIDLIGMPPRPVTVDDAVEMTKEVSTAWVRLSAEMRQASLIPDATGIIAMGPPGLMLRFTRLRKMHPIEALRKIDAVDPLPPAIVGAIMAAERAIRHQDEIGGLSIATMATICDMQPPRSEPPYSRKELEEMVSTFTTAIPDPDASVDMPAGAIDRARYWLMVARSLWQADNLRQIARQAVPYNWNICAKLAAAHLEIEDVKAVGLPTAKVRLGESRADRVLAWPQVLELAAGEIEQAALEWLCGGLIQAGPATLDREPDRFPEDLPDPDLANSLTETFLREAQERAAYAPFGAFEIDIPAGLPLRDWDVTGLKIWCNPGGLWVGALKGTDLSCIFEWRPGKPLRRWIVPEQAEPTINVTLAALWRDLRVAGEGAVPAEKVRRPRRTKRAGKRAKGPKPPLRLPRRQGGLRVTGRRTWATNEERERIKREAHRVPGFTRWLPKGHRRSKRAEGLAEKSNVVIPDGKTFVKSHVRGAGEARGAPKIRARGLMSLVAWLSREE